jgi:hypothetical protein
MSNKPIANEPDCDVPGCGHRAAYCTDGKEEDIQGLKRPAIKNINVCLHHMNWPHSDDAKRFVLTDAYRKNRG